MVLLHYIVLTEGKSLQKMLIMHNNSSTEVLETPEAAPPIPPRNVIIFTPLPPTPKSQGKNENISLSLFQSLFICNNLNYQNISTSFYAIKMTIMATSI